MGSSDWFSGSFWTTLVLSQGVGTVACHRDVIHDDDDDEDIDAGDLTSSFRPTSIFVVYCRQLAAGEWACELSARGRSQSNEGDVVPALVYCSTAWLYSFLLVDRSRAQPRTGKCCKFIYRSSNHVGYVVLGTKFQRFITLPLFLITSKTFQPVKVNDQTFKGAAMVCVWKKKIALSYVRASLMLTSWNLMCI